MTRKEAIRQEQMLARLQCLGISRQDAETLRRISMTLHRWNEMECGIDNGCIERDETTAKPFWLNSYSMRRTPIADREAGAVKRLNAIMAKYPTLASYAQGDPRGAVLYILRPDDVPEGASADSYYSRGIAVHK